MYVFLFHPIFAHNYVLKFTFLVAKNNTVGSKTAVQVPSEKAIKKEENIPGIVFNLLLLFLRPSQLVH